MRRESETVDERSQCYGVYGCHDAASGLAALQSTVTELGGEMSSFVQRLAEDDVAMSANEEA